MSAPPPTRRPRLTLGLAAALLLAAHGLHAQDTAAEFWVLPRANIEADRPCWTAAARYQNLNPWLLQAIGWVESRHDPNAVHLNHDGTVDLGLMQINSSWWGQLRGYGITRADLRNACISTYVGAWVLRQAWDRYGNSWKFIAAYNTGTVSTRAQYRTGLAYARRVYQAYARIVSGRLPGS